MNDKNIVLIGFMGSGKTSTAKALGELLKRKVVSTDSLIEKREGCKIKEIFAKHSQAYFRQVEKEVVRECSELQNVIIDCGGGVVTQKENMPLLKYHSYVVYLKTSIKVILKRTRKDKNRPLLNVLDPQIVVQTLLLERDPLYTQAADRIIVTDGKNALQVAREIVEETFK